MFLVITVTRQSATHFCDFFYLTDTIVSSETLFALANRGYELEIVTWRIASVSLSIFLFSFSLVSCAPLPVVFTVSCAALPVVFTGITLPWSCRGWPHPKELSWPASTRSWLVCRMSSPLRRSCASWPASREALLWVYFEHPFRQGNIFSIPKNVGSICGLFSLKKII